MAIFTKIMKNRKFCKYTCKTYIYEMLGSYNMEEKKKKSRKKRDNIFTIIL